MFRTSISLPSDIKCVPVVAPAEDLVAQRAKRSAESAKPTPYLNTYQLNQFK